MKLFSLLCLFICFSMFLSSCSDWTDEHDKFVNTYKDILALRMMFPDTAIANPKVDSVYRRNGFTRESFKIAYFKYAEDPELFRAMIDSARIRAQRDYIKLDSVNAPVEKKTKIEALEKE